MKKTVSVICVVLVLALSLSLAACGKSGSGSGGKDFSGNYKLIELSAAGQDMTSYLDMVGEVTLVIEGDKATLKIGEDTTEMTVDSTAMTFSSDGAVSSFTFEDNKLTLEEKTADTKMVFEKQ